MMRSKLIRGLCAVALCLGAPLAMAADPVVLFTVIDVPAGGIITPILQIVPSGETAVFTVKPRSGYAATVTGCSGQLVGNTYTTSMITANCTVKVAFKTQVINKYTVTATAGAFGTITPAVRTVNAGATTTFTVKPNAGYVATVSGCNGTLMGNIYKTGAITGNCTVNAVFNLDTAANDGMVRIMAGCFVMGSPESEPERYSDETQHQVCIDNDFYMGKYEVTFDEYDAFCDATGCAKPSDNGWGRGKRPVINVSWNDATAYAAWLSNKTGLKYRLPTEAEWEYAARAGTTTAYWWGSAASHEYANYGTDSCCDGLVQGRDQWFYTAPVGSFPANPWGLYDTMGNVWEWTCSNWANPYDGTEKTCTTTGTAGNRVLRGGSWSGYPGGVRSAYRSWYFAGYRSYGLGFRLSRSLF